MALSVHIKKKLKDFELAVDLSDHGKEKAGSLRRDL